MDNIGENIFNEFIDDISREQEELKSETLSRVNETQIETPSPLLAETPTRRRIWPWIGGLSGIFFIAVISESIDSKPANNLEESKHSVQTQEETISLRPHVEADFVDQFYIVKYGTSLKGDSGKTRYLPAGTCVDRFTLYNSDTISGNYLHVLAPNGQGVISGYVLISSLKRAPSNMSEVQCNYP